MPKDDPRPLFVIPPVASAILSAASAILAFVFIVVAAFCFYSLVHFRPGRILLFLIGTALFVWAALFTGGLLVWGWQNFRFVKEEPFWVPKDEKDRRLPRWIGNEAFEMAGGVSAATLAAITLLLFFASPPPSYQMPTPHAADKAITPQ